MATTIDIVSRVTGKVCRINRFTEYVIDMDLEVDSDQFNMVFTNPGGEYTGVINKFDPVDISINGVGVIKGTVDEVEYNWDNSDSVIRVMGRDMMSIFVDNDAIPATKQSIKPSRYITDKCNEYGIQKYEIDPSPLVINELIIGCSETELSVMDNLIIDSKKRLWCIYDTLYMGAWSTGIDPVYKFTRGLDPSESGIRILSLKFRDSGLNMKSEYRIYGTMGDGTEKVMGTANNQYMVSQGIKKRKILRSTNNDSTTKYSSSALEHIRDDFRNDIVLTLTIYTNDVVVLPNRCALVIDSETKINSIFFIKGVTYNKNLSGGSITTITMIPGESTFNVIWTNQGKAGGGIVGYSGMSLTDLLKGRK